MALSNTAVPKYYGMFRDAVIRGEIPVCREIEMEMNRIDDLIANPGIYYDDQAVEGFISYCENELTLTDGSDLKLLDTFKKKFCKHEPYIDFAAPLATMRYCLLTNLFRIDFVT